MDLRWMILPVFLVFLVFVEAENVTVVKATLSQNAIFTCSGDIKDTYWYIEISSQVKGFIAQTFSMDPNDTRYDIHTTLKTKYVAKGNIFEITNITAGDCRLYFCARKEGGNITFKDTFLLVSDDPITPSTNNNTEGNHQQQQNSCILCQSEVIYSSLALNILFILVIIGLVLTLLCLKRKKCNCHRTDPSSCIYDNLQRKKCNRQGTDPSSCIYENPETMEMPKYKEIQLRKFPPAVASSETIYCWPQLPPNPRKKEKDKNKPTSG
ncbi:uncharacterized protein LOC120554770 [Perca fluviatilis]|uniref:uncharacterized protein LOC120554770 n=1 Tax=Perca fluviatilis TaxID=8168 RepID=UPI00196444BB|nr:uncharacterized protein LOC120554770 [Perca fluviatilis]